ncbi:MAG TPA: bifunctional pyr operon transcriptional regulator/uracil phosphoribosyltransferase PyrR [Gammaproteobacteria bacterium]|nr:bifunctional pyr operon transcriptional regulator/uracil phosphoribosyltransferase PyrR [Gammaproteobacteria bacterium]
MPDTLDVQALLDDMASQLQTLLQQSGISDPVIIGIHTGGVWVAEALRQRLGLTQPVGTLSITFYRDDFTRIGLHPQVQPSDLPFDIDDRVIILVDDVLHTGRTIRAALNEIFDYGRPARVILATLVARPGRELPIAADVVGTTLELSEDEHVKLTGPEPLRLEKAST